MADRISGFPDSILCDILSSLPTKVELLSTNWLMSLRFVCYYFPFLKKKDFWCFDIMLYLLQICQQDLVSGFQNLVQLKMNLHYIKNWLELLESLKHCPKLQTLVICNMDTIQW